MNFDMYDSELELAVLCSIGTSHFAIPARRVQEIIRPPTIRVVHHALPFLLGVFNLRGCIVELIDPGKKLELEPTCTPEAPHILILNLVDSTVGVLVDSVVGVFPFEASSLKPIPENLPEVQRGKISGFMKIDDKVVAFLDVDALLKIPTEDKLMPREAAPHR